MTIVTRRSSAVALAAALVLSACTSPPPTTAAITIEAAPPSVPVATADARLQAFEQQQVERASRAEAQGRLAEAALAWEVLGLLRPGDIPTQERLHAARQRVETSAREHQATAEAAQRRGELELAAQAYLEVLALDPTRRAAADALRQIESERNRRSVVGRFARLTITKRTGVETEAPGVVAAEPARTANSLREHATLLSRQGDVDGAIGLLRDAPLVRSDASLKVMLVDLYLQKAELLRARQPQAARMAVDAALAIDRRHAAALALQQQLRKAKPGAAPRPGAAASAS